MSAGNLTEMNVLLIEDNPGDARLFEYHLETGMTEMVPSTSVAVAETLEDGFDTLAQEEYDLVLLDLGLPNSSGLATLERYNATVSKRDALDNIPVVVLTGLDDEETSVAAIEQGAEDYLIKDNVNRLSLLRTLRYAVERHQRQSEIRRQNERLARFASVVSHDLRNPLNVAQLHLEQIDAEGTQEVQENLTRMEAIIEDMLTLAREGEAVEETEQLELSTFVSRCWSQVETADATLSIEDGLTIEGDPNKCRQLFENLFRNAIEHVGNDVTIRVGALEDGFFVEDDGPGIVSDERENVFEAGYTTNENGTGFGLNIVEEIAIAHGWTVDIGGESDGGARFEFNGLEST
jgi:signal transduction histidine kinase